MVFSDGETICHKLQTLLKKLRVIYMINKNVYNVCNGHCTNVYYYTYVTIRTFRVLYDSYFPFLYFVPIALGENFFSCWVPYSLTFVGRHFLCFAEAVNVRHQMFHFLYLVIKMYVVFFEYHMYLLKILVCINYKN